MDRLQGVLGIAVIFGLVFAVSKYRTRINWRILGAGFALQVITAFLILKWEPGFQALQALSGGVSWLVSFANQGTTFVFGGLFNNDQIGFVFALGVLLWAPVGPVIADGIAAVLVGLVGGLLAVVATSAKDSSED